MPDLGAVGTIAERVGIPFAMTLILFFLMKQQEERHRKDREADADARDEMRTDYEKRAERMHGRMNDLTVQLMGVIMENTKVISTFVEMERRR